MKILRRILSLGVTLSLLMGLVVIPGKAAGEFTVSLADKTVSAGEEFTVDLSVENNPGFGSLTVNVYYRSDILTCTKVVGSSAWTSHVMTGLTDSSYSAFGDFKPDGEGAPADPGSGSWKAAILGYTTGCENGMTGDTALATLTFTAKAGLETGTTPLKIEVVRAADKTGNVALEASVQDATISINGLPPILQEVTLDQTTVKPTGLNGEDTTVTPIVTAGKANPSELDAADMRNLTWGVVREDGEEITGCGVSIAEDGKITVSKTAKNGVYTVSAEAPESSTDFSGGPVTATLTVEREGSKAADIALSEAASIAAPLAGENPATTTFTAEVKDQFGDPFTGTVEWDIEAADKTGVSINGGVVSVTNLAKAGDVTVMARCGDVTKRTTLTITKAPSAAKSITIEGATTLVKPVEENGTEDYTFTAKVLDQYGVPMTDAEVEWTVSDLTGEANSITAAKDETTPCQGKVTVHGTAVMNDEATLTATVSGTNPAVKAEVTIKITDLDLDWNSGGITYKETFHYGLTNGEAVRIGTTAVTAHAGSEAVEGTLSVVNGTEHLNVSSDAQTIQVVFTPDDASGKYGSVRLYKDCSVTVTPRPVEVTIADASRPYGGENPSTYTGAITKGNLVFGEDLTDLGLSYTCAAVAATPVADSPVAITGTSSSTNYAVTFVPGKLTITPYVLTTPAMAANLGEIQANSPLNTPGELLKRAKDLNDEVHVAEGVNDEHSIPMDPHWENVTVSPAYLATGVEYTYTLKPTSKDPNYTYNGGDVTVKVKVTPVTVTSVSLSSASDTLSVAQVEQARELTDLAAIPAEVTVTYDKTVAENQTKAATAWDKTIKDLKDAAARVKSSGTSETVTVTMTKDTFKALPWATLTGFTYPTVTLTISNRLAAVVTNFTYTGKEYDGTPNANPDLTNVSVADKAGKPLDKEAAAGQDSYWSYTYTGTAFNGTKYSGTTPPTDAGTYQIVAKYMSPTHEVTLQPISFTIEARGIGSLDAKLADADKSLVYDGKERKPVPTVTDTGIKVEGSDKVLKENTDYTLEYSANKNVGTAKITITGKGNYKGTKEVTFTITALPLPDAITSITGLSESGYTYTGSEIKPKVNVAVKDIGNLVEGTDYDLTYADNTAAGTAAKVTIIGKGNYSGTLTKNFTINKAALSGTVTLAVTTDAPEAGKIDKDDVLTATALLNEKDHLSYQWKRKAADGTTTDIGTNAATYTLVEADAAGSQIFVVVTSTDPNYEGSVESAPVVVDKKPMPTGVSVTVKAEADTAEKKIVITAEVTITNADDVLLITQNFQIRWFCNGQAMFSPVTEVDGKYYATYEATTAQAGTPISCTLVPKETTEGKEYSGAITPTATGSTVRPDTGVTGTLDTNGTMLITVDKPVAPTLTTSATETTITANWKPQGNVPYTNWSVECAKKDGTVVESQTLEADKDTYTFKGLESGKEYKITVKALDGSKAGEETTANETTKTPTQPSRPGGSHSSSSGGSSSSSSSNVTAKKTSNGSVSFSTTRAKKGETVTITVTPKNGYELDEITVLDKNGDRIRVREGEKTNTFTFVMPEGAVTVETTFKAKEDTEPTKDNPFYDVSEGAYYYDAVLWAVENEITGGTSATTFAPGAACTRAQTVTFLWRAAGRPNPQSTVNPFTDVVPGSYYYDAVLWAVEQGITNGLTETTFGPNATVNRGQVVTFLYRSAKAAPVDTPNPFTDVPENAYFNSPVLWAVANGITNGTTAATFAPGAPCTRGQIVTFLYRHFN